MGKDWWGRDVRGWGEEGRGGEGSEFGNGKEGEGRDKNEAWESAGGGKGTGSHSERVGREWEPRTGNRNKRGQGCGGMGWDGKGT